MQHKTTSAPRFTLPLVAALALAASPGCKRARAPSPTARFAGDETGARALCQAFLDPRTDRVALSMALQPRPADYRAVFRSAEVAQEAADHYAKLWPRVRRSPIGAREGQTELLLWGVTTDRLRAAGGRIDNFPGGYRAVAPLLRPGLKLYRWKYVKPGKRQGMAFDGLYHVNGRWILIPKPWQMLAAREE